MTILEIVPYFFEEYAKQKGVQIKDFSKYDLFG